MQRATEIEPHWHGSFIDEAVLGYAERRRRRVVLKARGGTEFLLDLSDAPNLQDGDAIVLETGMVRVSAADEELMEITCFSQEHLVRLAWHIGNRHLPAQFGKNWIRILADEVLADMARGLGAKVRSLSAPFSPERGAYASHANGGHHG